MRVLVADDHPLFRDGIISLLEAAGFKVVGQADDGQEAIDLANQLRPDLVLMDIAMPGMSGLEALRIIKTHQPETQVVMLTVSDDNQDLLEAAKSGASGYLLKNLNATQFLEMLAGLERGEAAITRKSAAQLIEGIAESSRKPPETPIKLTGRELELLEHISQGLSNKAIAQAMSISENTVKYHIRNILQKLGVQNRTEAVTYALQVGLFKPRNPQ